MSSADVPGFKEMGRLAFRQEGVMWNAYYAVPGTMKDAILLGSIAQRFVIGNDARRSAFMELMKEAVGDILENITGKRPQWPEPEGHPAPEHERTKTA